MADDTNVSVNIAADASGVQDGVDAAKAALGDLGDQAGVIADAVKGHGQAMGDALGAGLAAASGPAGQFAAMTDRIGQGVQAASQHVDGFAAGLAATGDQVQRFQAAFTAGPAAPPQQPQPPQSQPGPQAQGQSQSQSSKGRHEQNQQAKDIAAAGKIQVADLKTDGTVGGLQLQGQEQSVRSQAKMGQIDPQQELAQIQSLHAQEFQLQQQTAEQIAASQTATLNQELATYAAGTDAYKQKQRDIAALADATANKQRIDTQKYANQMAADTEHAAEQSQQHWLSIVQPVTSGFASMTEGMLEHTETFGQGMEKMLTQLLNTFIQWEFTQLAHHIAGEAAKTAATGAGATARLATEQSANTQGLLMDMQATMVRITNAAAAAAAKAFTFFADMGPLAIPLGAAAAAVTFTAVEAYGALASASGGYDIGNENPLTQLHAQEMVLPASIANPLRGMIASNSGGGAGGGASGGGGTTYNTTFAPKMMDTRSFARFANNSGNVRAAAGAFARHG